MRSVAAPFLIASLAAMLMASTASAAGPAVEPPFGGPPPLGAIMPNAPMYAPPPPAYNAPTRGITVKPRRYYRAVPKRPQCVTADGACAAIRGLAPGADCTCPGDGGDVPGTIGTVH